MRFRNKVRNDIGYLDKTTISLNKNYRRISMKKRKFKVLLSLFLGAAVMVAGCSSGGDDDDGVN